MHTALYFLSYFRPSNHPSIHYNTYSLCPTHMSLPPVTFLKPTDHRHSLANYDCRIWSTRVPSVGEKRDKKAERE